MATGDVDGDGDADLVAFLGANIELFVSDGKGAFVREASPELAASPEHLGCEGYSVEIVDLDGDGRREVVANLAGEQGSEVLFGQAPICKSGGALRVFKVAAASQPRPPAPSGGTGGPERP